MTQVVTVASATTSKEVDHEGEKWTENCCFGKAEPWLRLRFFPSSSLSLSSLYVPRPANFEAKLLLGVAKVMTIYDVMKQTSTCFTIGLGLGLVASDLSRVVYRGEKA